MRTSLDIAAINGLEVVGRYYSIYPGVVVNTNRGNKQDPDNSVNDIEVYISNLDYRGWACQWQCYNGPNYGIKTPLPRVNETVMVMFSYGEAKCPFWTYAGWLFPNSIPEDLRKKDRMGLVTYNGNKIFIDDETGELFISTQGTIHIDSAQTIALNGGTNEGLIKINELTQKLNKTIQELEELRNLYNTHIHTGVTTGPGSSGVPDVTLPTAFTKYNKADYENDKITH